MSERWGIPSTYKSAPQKPLFFHDFANLTVYLFGMKHDTHVPRGQVRCKLQRVSYIVSKQHELWSTNGFKLEVSFHQPSVNSAFNYYQASQTKISKRISTKLCQTVDDKSR